MPKFENNGYGLKPLPMSKNMQNIQNMAKPSKILQS